MTSSQTKLITSLKNEIPHTKSGGVAGFFSTSPINSIEYAPEIINIEQLENDVGLQAEGEWLAGGQAGNRYTLVIDSKNLYCKEGGYSGPEHFPASEEAHRFHVNTVQSGSYTFPIFAIPLCKIKEILIKTCSGSVQTGIGPIGYEVQRLVFNLTDGRNFEFNYTFDDSGLHLKFLASLQTELQPTFVKDDMLEVAKRHEELLEFDQAAELYKKLGMDDKVVKVRKEARNKVEQTVVHGDYVDDRDTIVKDSVVNKSKIGGASSKLQELKDLKELLDSGAINDNDYEKLKEEILNG